MPIYGILKKYLGEYLDLFVIILICILGYYGILNRIILKASMETLLFFYFYKIYYMTFVRQWDGSRKYTFSWDFNKIFTDKFLKRNKWFIYLVLIICILMPWNLFWYILITIIVNNKLMKVWLNGNKDIFFFKYFKYDIRPVYERYIIWYYDNIDKYVRIFVHEPFNRMIIMPTIIRNSLIHASFFSILKARMFMFVFISILVYTGINEYLHQPLYIWIIIIYIYLLLVWPRIIKMFNIEYANYEGQYYSYATPQTIFLAFLLVQQNSVSFQCFRYFLFYLTNSKINSYICLYYYFIFPVWYYNLFIFEFLDNKGHIVYANNDRKFSAIMFWRYEKTYTSFICFRIFEMTGYYNSLLYKFSLDYGFYGRYISEEEVEEMKRFLELYIHTCFFLLGDILSFINPNPINFSKYLFDSHETNKLSDCDSITMDFFNDKKLIINNEEIMLKFISIKRYKKMFINISLFYRFDDRFWITKDYKIWLFSYILDLKIGSEDGNGKIFRKEIFSDRWWELLGEIIDKTNNKTLFLHERKIIDSIFEEYLHLLKEKGKEGLVSIEDIERLIKFK